MGELLLNELIPNIVKGSGNEEQRVHTQPARSCLTLERPPFTESSFVLAGPGTRPVAPPHLSKITDFVQETPLAKFERSQLVKMSLCKTMRHLYAIHDENGKFVEFKTAPSICGSPLCVKCVHERKLRYMQKFAPFIDDEIYSPQDLRHIIATTPRFSRSELPVMSKLISKNMTKFHRKMSRSYHYAFNGLALLELKYDAETDEYYFHVHYGVISFVNIGEMRRLWCKTWGMDLVVKFPRDKRTGKPKFYTNKWGYLEYASRRRAEQAFRIPRDDYFNHVRHMQLFRRVGFSEQAITRILTEIVQKYSRGADLPAGWTMRFLGNIPQDFNLRHFGERYRSAVENITLEDLENVSPAACSRMIARNIFEEMFGETRIREISSSGGARPEDPSKIHYFATGADADAYIKSCMGVASHV